MLWNGVSRTPRFRAYRWRKRSSSKSAAAADSPPLRGGFEAKVYSARAPSWITFQGRWCAWISAATPSLKRRASGIMRSNAAGVRICSSVARMAATLEHILTPAAFERMIPLARRFNDGVAAEIHAHHLPWNVIQLGARAEYTFASKPPRNGGESAAAADFELDLYALNRG